MIYLEDSYIAGRLHAHGGDVEATIADVLAIQDTDIDRAYVRYPITASEARQSLRSYHGGWTVANAIKLAQHVKDVKSRLHWYDTTASSFILTR